MFSRSSKTLLRNAIRHADVHNRHVEESDMWSQRTRKSMSEGYKPLRRAHMDKEDPPTSPVRRSTYWARELQKTEEADPDRWGHGGFKEMYPDEFNSDRSSSDSDIGIFRRQKSPVSRKRRKKKSDHRSSPDVRPDRREKQDRSRNVITLYSSVHTKKEGDDQKPRHKDSSKNSHRVEKSDKKHRKRRHSESTSEQENITNELSSSRKKHSDSRLKKPHKSDSRDKSRRSRSNSRTRKHSSRSHGNKDRRQRKSRSRSHDNNKNRRTFKDSDSSSDSD